MFRPPLTIGAYQASRRDPQSPRLADEVWRGLVEPVSVSILADRHSVKPEAILAVVLANPKRFLEREGLIHRL